MKDRRVVASYTLMKASLNAGDEAFRQMSQAVRFDKSEGIKVLLLGR